MVINLARTRISHPGGTIQSARFVYHNGRAAVWVEDKKTRTATRLLWSDGVTFNKPKSARLPMTATLPNDEVWEIKQERQGCGCTSPLKNIPISQLLDYDNTSL